MSVLAIVVIAVGVVVLVVLIGGIVAVRRRAATESGVFDERVAAADRALEAARVEDKGWDRGVLEQAARNAVSDARPGWSYDELYLVLVDDRPGVTEDRAQFVAIGDDDEVRIYLARQDAGWLAERVD